MKRLLSFTFAIAMSMSLPTLAAPGDFSSERFAQRSPDQQQGPQRGGRAAGPRGGAPGSAQVAPGRGPQGDSRGRGQIAQDRRGVGRAVDHGPREFEKRAFQRNYPAPRRFRLGAFRPPPGWQYRRWVYGQYLPPMFWVRTYWITNFWLYNLDRPPIGCEWIRYGNDALLVDVVTGEILQVVYDVFY